MRLSRQIFLRILGLGTVVLAVLLVVSYRIALDRAEEARTADIVRFMNATVAERDRRFARITAYMRRFNEEFLAYYDSDLAFSEEDFHARVETGPDGAVRSRRAFYAGRTEAGSGRRSNVTAFVGANQPVTDPDFRRRLLVAWDLVARFAPMLAPDGLHLHATFPENALVIWHPTFPWGLEARADLRMNEHSTIGDTLVTANPERRPVWSGVYIDRTQDAWVLSHLVPLDHQGRHLVNASVDISLEAMSSQLLEHPFEQARTFLVADDGRVIAHPAVDTVDPARVDVVGLEDVETTLVTEAVRDTAGTGDVRVVDRADTRELVFVAALEGPALRYVLVYDRSRLAALARRDAVLVLIVSLVLFAALIAVTFVVVRNQASVPLRSIRDVVRAIGDGDYAAVARGDRPLPTTLRNEVGELAMVTRQMAAEVEQTRTDLERLVRERTRALEEANSKLSQLSLLDGLTGLHNRRSFDADLANLVAEARRGEGEFALLMLDVDHFKQFNDRHGHVAGDAALRVVADALRATVRETDRVYRYGGEEFAVLATHLDARFAGRFFERLRAALAAADTGHEPLTISAGAARFSAGTPTASAVIERADAALYAAKTAGRDQLADADAPVSDSNNEDRPRSDGCPASSGH